MANEAFPRPPFIPSIFYKDNRAALAWLERAFGFELAFFLTDSSGAIVHAEMTHGGGAVMIGSEWTGWTRSPLSVDGGNTQCVGVTLERDIDAHCERARAAGAVIEEEPSDQFYGDRTYRAVDPEGHHWTFRQPLREVSLEEMEKASGLAFTTRT